MQARRHQHKCNACNDDDDNDDADADNDDVNIGKYFDKMSQI